MSRSLRVGAARIGAIGFLAIALGCAALAAFTFGSLAKSRYSGARVAPVVVARRELRAGQPLTSDGLEVRDWPADAIPTGAYATLEELLTSNKGATPTVGILAGEPVVASRLSSSQAGTGIASLIRPNMRAIAVDVDDATGSTGLVYPGAFVDVVASVRDPMGRGPSARIAVQNARVLSVGTDTDVATRRTRRDDDDRSGRLGRGTFVTLEVTPDEAEIIAVARNEGRINVVLRNATDDEIIDTQGATPERFSAFAADASGAHRPKRGVTVQRDKRRIQIIASDKPDTGNGAIEVYHAK